MTMRGGTSVIFCLALGLVLTGNGAVSKFVSTNPCMALQNGSKMPNTEDCSSYYVCEFNQMTKTQCDEGTLFDPELLVCNWASLVECGETPIARPIEELTTRRPVRVPARKTTAAPAVWQPEVPAQDAWWPQSNTYWHPELPAPFFPTYPIFQPQYPQYGFQHQGFNNQPVTDTTTRTTTSRSTTARTTSRRTTTPRTTTPRTTTPKTTTEWTTKATRAPYNPPQRPSAAIPLDADKNLQCDNRGLYFLAHPKNCENYYICANGVMVLHQCASGVHWNEKDSKCDFPHRANCFANQRPASAPHIERPTPNCEGTERFLTHESDCSMYYICAGKTPTLMTCPGNFLWDSSISQCAEASTVTCFLE